MNFFNEFIFSENSKIESLFCCKNFLAFSTHFSYKVLNICNNLETVIEKNLNEEKTYIFFLSFIYF